MKTGLWLAVLLAADVMAADVTRVERMFDGKSTSTQRVNACFELRGNSDEETIRAMARALENQDLVACAAENLRLIKAIEPLKEALESPSEQARAAAARELGFFQDPALIDALTAAAEDVNALVASNALEALSAYSDPAVVPHLVELAKKGGMIGDMALERILQLDTATALAIARPMLASPQVPDKLYAMRTLGAAGDTSDLPDLRRIAASKEEAPVQRARGFGLMPPINLARAAQSAIDAIESRTAGEPRP